MNMLKPLILFYFILKSTCSFLPSADCVKSNCSRSPHSLDEPTARTEPPVRNEATHSIRPVRLLSKRSVQESRIDPRKPERPSMLLNRIMNSAAKFFSNADSVTDLNLKSEARSRARLTSTSKLGVNTVEDVDLEMAIRLKCYLSVIRSLKKMSFFDLLFVRRDRIRSDWYRRNEDSCRRLLQFRSSPAQSYRIFPGLIELKLLKMRLMFILVKWKLDAILKFKVWFLVIVMRFKQAIFGKNIIRDEDISLLVRLFFPELFSPHSGGLTDSFKQIA